MGEVLLVNANNNVSLTIARALGVKGVPVDGVCFDGAGVGMYSRYLGTKVFLENYRQLTVEKLSEVLSVTKAKYVMAMGEDVLTHLNTLRNQMSSDVVFLFPEQDILQHALDKSITLKYAEQLGIDFPKTFKVRSFDGLEVCLRDIEYPVVLKFPQAIPNIVPPDIRFKYRYIYDQEELVHLFECYREYNVFPLIQEYIPGKGLGVELCLHKGVVVGAFQHERIHEFPISGGVSVYRKSVPLSHELLNNSIRLLRAMRWEGVGMVEFRQDLRSKRIALMEVNGRFWGSLPVALKAGVNFPYILYRTMGQGQMMKPRTYTYEVKVKQISSHFKWLIHAFWIRKNLPPEGFMSRPRVLWEFLLSLSPHVRFDIEECRDPLPGIHFWRDIFMQHMKRSGNWS